MILPLDFIPQYEKTKHTPIFTGSHNTYFCHVGNNWLPETIYWKLTHQSTTQSLGMYLLDTGCRVLKSVDVL